MGSFRTIEWKNNRVYMLDQTKLPNEEIYLELNNYIDVANAIKNMVIRGAPAIGIAAAMGIALGANKITGKDKEKFFHKLDEIYTTLAATRPTAVNLFWAIDRMKEVVENNRDLEIKKFCNKNNIDYAPIFLFPRK